MDNLGPNAKKQPLIERKRREEPLVSQPPPVVKEGVEAAQKDTIKKKAEDKEKADNLVNKSNRIIVQATSVFPFQLFPTKIFVEDTKVVIIFNSFFSISESHTIDIRDITNVFVGKGPFFASLDIVSRTFKENFLHVSKLWRKDAEKLHDMIEGLRLFHREDISPTSFETKELIEKLRAISKKEIS